MAHSDTEHHTTPHRSFSTTSYEMAHHAEEGVLCGMRIGFGDGFRVEDGGCGFLGRLNFGVGGMNEHG